MLTFYCSCLRQTQLSSLTLNSDLKCKRIEVYLSSNQTTRHLSLSYKCFTYDSLPKISSFIYVVLHSGSSRLFVCYYKFSLSKNLVLWALWSFHNWLVAFPAGIYYPILFITPCVIMLANASLLTSFLLIRHMRSFTWRSLLSWWFATPSKPRRAQRPHEAVD